MHQLQKFQKNQKLQKKKMKTDARSKILNRIAAVRRQTDAAFSFDDLNNEDIYKPVLPDAVTCFKTELEAISGKCEVCVLENDVFIKLADFLQINNLLPVFCRDTDIQKKLIQNNIPFTDKESDFETMRSGVTGCELLVARTGSVLVTSAGDSGRQMNVFPPVHIVLATTSQLVNYPGDALEAIRKRYGNNLPSAITTITGPSRTADIEKTLVLGAHGPKEFVVFLSEK